MAAHAETTHLKPRLNPFAFPSDTDFRFVMLVTATISASFLIYNFLYNAFPVNSNIYSNHILSCMSTATNAHPGNSFDDQKALIQFYTSCIAPDYRLLAAWVGLGIALLLSVAGVIYWVLPSWKIWRDGLRPLESSNAHPGMMVYLAELCRQAELRHAPVFLLNPYSSAASGVAFGHFGRYYIVLHAGLIRLYQDDRLFFRAVLLHELAHLRNGDINKTYFTIAIVWSFLLTALLPWIVSELITSISYQRILDVFTTGWPVLVLTVVIYLIRNAILRARELYADARASIWEGSDGALGRVLSTLSHPKGGSLWRFLRTHPDPEKRQRLLQDTSSLFYLGFWDAFTVGIIVTGVLSNVNWLLLLVFNNSIPEKGPGIIGAPLIAGTIGLGMWRAIFSRQAYDQVLPNFIGVILGLGLGLLLGQPLTVVANFNGVGYFTDLGYRSGISFPPAGQSLLTHLANEQLTLSTFFTQLVSIVVVSALLLVLLYGLVRWLIACFATWLHVAAGSSSPRRTYWTGLLITSIVLGVFLGEFSYYANFVVGSLTSSTITQTFEQSLSQLPPNPIIKNIIVIIAIIDKFDPLITVSLICLWAYPVASWFWRKKVSNIAASSWTFLDKSFQPRMMSPAFQEPFRLRLALILGLAGGVAFCVIFYLIEFTLNLNQPFPYIVLLAALLQGGVALIVAGSVLRHPLFHALFAAFVASCVMGIGLTGVVLLIQRHITLEVAWKEILYLNGTGLYPTILNAGMLLALLVGLVVSTLTGWLRRLSRAHQHVYEPVA